MSEGILERSQKFAKDFADRALTELTNPLSTRLATAFLLMSWLSVVSNTRHIPDEIRRAASLYHSILVRDLVLIDGGEANEAQQFVIYRAFAELPYDALSIDSKYAYRAKSSQIAC